MEASKLIDIPLFVIEQEMSDGMLMLLRCVCKTFRDNIPKRSFNRYNQPVLAVVLRHEYRTEGLVEVLRSLFNTRNTEDVKWFVREGPIKDMPYDQLVNLLNPFWRVFVHRVLNDDSVSGLFESNPYLMRR
jgi:hypothetical protein